MAKAQTFRSNHNAVVRRFLDSWEDLLASREEWIALGGAAYTDEIPAEEWTAPTEVQFNDSMYAVGALEIFLNGLMSNTGEPHDGKVVLDENVYRQFLYRVAD